MPRIRPLMIALALLLLTTTFSHLALTYHSLAASSLFPSLSNTGPTLTISSSSMVSQVELNKPNLIISYPQDQQQEFRLGVAFRQLMEIAPANPTLQMQIFDTVNLQTPAWVLTQVGNGSGIQFGRYLRLQLSTTTLLLQRGSNVYPLNMSLRLFASERQNQTTVVADDWACPCELIGGPTKIKLDVSISGWAFRSVQDMLVLRLSMDGSQGTVRHHGEFAAREPFNTIGIFNDVTRRQDAYVQWLQRAIIDNGTSRRSAEVTLKTFQDGQGTGVDLYYPSFENGSLNHDPIIGTSGTFFPAPFVPVQFATLLIGGASLLALTLFIVYLSRHSYLNLHRNK